MFPRPRPTNLLRVPACASCNRGFCLDDEYFALVMSVQQRAEGNRAASGASSAALKRLAERRGIPFTEKFLSTVRPVDLRTPAGLYIGRSLQYDVDLVRVTRTVRRVMRGLAFHHLGWRDPTGLEAFCAGIDAWPDSALEDSALTGSIVRAVVSTPVRGDNPSVLRYWFTPVSDAPEVTIWVLQFYLALPFVGSLGPAGGLAAAEGRKGRKLQSWLGD